MSTAKLNRIHGRRPTPTTPLTVPAHLSLPVVRPVAPAAPVRRGFRWSSLMRRLDARRWEIAVAVGAALLACLLVPMVSAPADPPTGPMSGDAPPPVPARIW